MPVNLTSALKMPLITLPACVLTPTWTSDKNFLFDLNKVDTKCMYLFPPSSNHTLQSCNVGWIASFRTLCFLARFSEEQYQQKLEIWLARVSQLNQPDCLITHWACNDAVAAATSWIKYRKSNTGNDYSMFAPLIIHESFKLAQTEVYGTLHYILAKRMVAGPVIGTSCLDLEAL